MRNIVLSLSALTALAWCGVDRGVALAQNSPPGRADVEARSGVNANAQVDLPDAAVEPDAVRPDAAVEPGTPNRAAPGAARDGRDTRGTIDTRGDVNARGTFENRLPQDSRDTFDARGDVNTRGNLDARGELNARPNMARPNTERRNTFDTDGQAGFDPHGSRGQFSATFDDNAPHGDRSRFQFFSRQWWYRQPGNQWMVYSNGQWAAGDPPFLAQGQPDFQGQFYGQPTNGQPTMGRVEMGYRGTDMHQQGHQSYGYQPGQTAMPAHGNHGGHWGYGWGHGRRSCRRGW